ncbi:hypothetical protein FDP41_000398 [Naegleria fowleri]|uniref:Regulator of chromosome condensation domain-containing protein n=1 Tax=Naegleria fowleri TaxID=5763 RepID=A0A6A5CGR6_NAEFO|nr:uncharacterized protein FDP41_000398 [Naegleria fowleri]KAF0984499.1 hypothetical protein FDP41_000398 [Naegleria fowleri]
MLFRISPSVSTPPRPSAAGSSIHHSTTMNILPTTTAHSNLLRSKQMQEQQGEEIITISDTIETSSGSNNNNNIMSDIFSPQTSPFELSSSSSPSTSSPTLLINRQDSAQLRRRRDNDALTSMENTTPQGSDKGNAALSLSFSNVSMAVVNQQSKKRKMDISMDDSSTIQNQLLDSNAEFELDSSFEMKMSNVIGSFEDQMDISPSTPKNEKKKPKDEYKGPRFDSTNRTIAKYGEDHRVFIVGLLGYDFSENDLEVTPTNDSNGNLQRLKQIFSNLFNNQIVPFLSTTQTNSQTSNSHLAHIHQNIQASSTTSSSSSNNNNPQMVHHNNHHDDHSTIHGDPAKECSIISRWREVPQLRNTKIKQLSCGGYHVLILTENNEVYGAGWNKYGQIGTRKFGSSSKVFKTRNERGEIDYCEVQPFHKIEFPEKVVSLNASGRHSLFISESGRVYGSGCRLHGRMGSEFIDVPLPHKNHEEENSYPLEAENSSGLFSPKLLGGILKEKRAYYVGKAFWHSIVATCDLRVYAMGQGDEGKLGIGFIKPYSSHSSTSSNTTTNTTTTTTTNFPPTIPYEGTHCYEPTEIVELRGRELMEAEGGAWHTIFLTKSTNPNLYNNDVWVCGSNYWGQLALPSKKHSSSSSSPDFSTTNVPVIHPFFCGKRNPSTNPIQVCAGSNFNAVLCEDGSVYCFGCGSSGKTGMGHCRTVKTPTKLTSVPKNITSISTGSNHLVLLTSTGDLYSVGWNFYGQCGYDQDIENINKIKDTSVAPLSEGESLGQTEPYHMPKINRLTGVEVQSVATGAYFTIITTSETSNKRKQEEIARKRNGIHVRSGFNDISVLTQL